MLINYRQFMDNLLLLLLNGRSIQYEKIAANGKITRKEIMAAQCINSGLISKIQRST
jgi:hypothetical protein